MTDKFKFLLEELLVAIMKKDDKAVEAIQAQIDELEDVPQMSAELIRLQSKQIAERAKARIN